MNMEKMNIIIPIAGPEKKSADTEYIKSLQEKRFFSVFLNHCSP